MTEFGKDKPKPQQADQVSDTDLLKKKIENLLGEDVVSLIDLELPPKREPTDASEKHKARTARYKKSVAMQLAPDSGACRHAMSNVLLEFVMKAGRASEGLLRMTIQELENAGYDREASRDALLRLALHQRDRRRDWQVRTRQKLAAHLIESLKAAGE